MNESTEYVRLRSEQMTMAAHEAMRTAPPGVYDDDRPTRADVADEVNAKRAVCLMCGERREMPVVAHVCGECASMEQEGA